MDWREILGEDLVVYDCEKMKEKEFSEVAGGSWSRVLRRKTFYSCRRCVFVFVG